MDQLYALMAERGLTVSRRHLSREWLGAAPNYVCLRGDRLPSDSAMLHLIRKLLDHRRYILAAYVLRMLIWPDRPDRKLPWQ